MSEPSTAVATRDLTKIYLTGSVRVAALDGVSIELGTGSFACITGPSGSGKSTLLSLLGGLDTPSAGSIEVQGRRISEFSRDELARYRRFSVGMIFQSFELVQSKTAAENVELPLIFAGVAKKERRRRAAALLAQVGLAARARHRPSELSGGEQQRVAIARALVNEPRLLLADEPTGNLDSRTGADIIGALGRLNRERGLTILMVTHELSLARQLASTVIQMQDGRVLSMGALV